MDSPLTHMYAPKYNKEGTKQIQALGADGNMTVGLLMTKDLAKAITAIYGLHSPLNHESCRMRLLTER